MKIRTLLTAAAVAVLGLTAAPAQASGVAVCEPFAPPGSAAVQGYGTWTPAVTAVPADHQWSMELDADCTSPGSTGSDAGAYQISLAGSSFESCGTGNGSGTVSGSGPQGGLSGTISWYKIGVHYYMSGSFVSGGHNHSLTLWIDVIPTVGGDACYYGYAAVFGHGAVYGHAPVAQSSSGRAGDCAYEGGNEPAVTGQNHEGTVRGQAVAAAGNVAIRCYITVNGTVVASSPTATGVMFAATSGRVSFVARDTDVVQLCSEVSRDTGSEVECGDVTRTDVPPQVLIDVLDAIA